MMVFEMNIKDKSNIQYYSSEEENLSESSDDNNSDNGNLNNELIIKEQKKKVIELEELQDSYYYNVFWTAKEKEQLFKGIERYGKYNADKIKKLIPNKSTIDIRMYISLLHKKYKYLKNNRSQELYKKDEIYNYYESSIIESTEEEIKKEEINAIQLVNEEQSKSNDKNEFGTKDYAMILRLFNVHLMLSLTTKLFIRKREAGIHKDTLVFLYLQYIQWLRRVIKTVILVTEKRQMKKKTNSKCYISIEDLNETFYVMNFKNYQIDSPLSKLVFRRQGQFLLNALFRIKHSFRDFVHPDIKKSIIDEQTNTWARPYDVQPRFHRTGYNDLLNQANTEEIKEYFEKKNNRKREIYNRYIKNHGRIDRENGTKTRKGNNRKDNGDENEIVNSSGINNNENENDDINNSNDDTLNNDNNDVEDNEEESYLKNNNNFDHELLNNYNEDNNENVNNDYEGENEEIDDEDADDMEDSMTEDSTTDDNYYESDEEDNINKLIHSNFITRRSNRRLSNCKNNLEFIIIFIIIINIIIIIIIFFYFFFFYLFLSKFIIIIILYYLLIIYIYYFSF